MKTFATFKLNQQLFGLEILYIREINKQIDITPVQHTPEYIRGLINLRGQIVTVMDLNRRMSPYETVLDENACNIIIRTDAELSPLRQIQKREDLVSAPESVGLLVDEIDEIVSVEEAAINAPPSNIGEIDGHYLDGIIQLENQLLAVLSIPRLLESTQKPSNPMIAHSNSY